MNNESPLVNKTCLLKKFPGKGGWTYAEVPEIPPHRNNPFGWVQVKGSIDDHQLQQYKLMPMGNGQLFLPVKAQIRKKIGKEAGDYVQVVLYPDNSRLDIPEEIKECFALEAPKIFETFCNFTQGEQKAYLDWIYEAKTDETKTIRIVRMMERLQRKLRLHDRERQISNE